VEVDLVEPEELVADMEVEAEPEPEAAEVAVEHQELPVS